ncbi:MAG: SRPBCC domain-containing protein [Bdellovibrionales bacterium]|nr:SRPBCC domain-containing protein [Bdellovibrionales bacterium]NQZ18411.1 SRPBCC domain-containing protein [Bdellovibrionales bacterium]
MSTVRKLKIVYLLTVAFIAISCLPSKKDNKALSFEKRVEFTVDVNQLWQALTTEEELSRWWNKGVKLEPKVGGQFYEPWGKEQLATGEVLSLKPQEYIEFTWREKTWEPSQKTVCRFEVRKNSSGSVLIVKHSGWESFEKPKPAMEGFKKGWDFFLAKLKKHLSKVAKDDSGVCSLGQDCHPDL